MNIRGGTCLSGSESECSSSGVWVMGTERCWRDLLILKSTEVVLRRACSSATDSEYAAKSQGDCFCRFGLSSTSSCCSSSYSDCESSISSSLGGSNTKPESMNSNSKRLRLHCVEEGFAIIEGFRQGKKGKKRRRGRCLFIYLFLFWRRLSRSRGERNKINK